MASNTYDYDDRGIPFPTEIPHFLNRDPAADAYISQINEKTATTDVKRDPLKQKLTCKFEVTKAFKIANTVENIEMLLEGYGIVVRYNEMSKDIEILIPGEKFSLDNGSNCDLGIVQSLCARNSVPAANLESYLKIIGDRNSYHPVRKWIEQYPWDGKSRVKDMIETLRVNKEQTEIRDILVYRWLIAAVAALYAPGFKADGALVLVGKQGIGKTSWLNRLAPAELSAIKTGATLNPSDKDSVVAVVSHWLCELGELDGSFRKADIAPIKGFITDGYDELRRPYDRLSSKYARKTVLYATVNDSKYLIDTTGNRRWWTVDVESIDYTHDINVQQLMAELKTLYEAGERWHLISEEKEMLNEHNKEYQITSPIDEALEHYFDWSQPEKGDKMSATQVLLALGYDKPNGSLLQTTGAILRARTGKQPGRDGGKRYYVMPPKAKPEPRGAF